jgi:hypothetical protein
MHAMFDQSSHSRCNRWRGDDGRVDAAEQFAIIGHRLRACGRGGFFARTSKGIGHRDKLNAGRAGQELRVNAAQVAASDHCHSQRVHAARLRSRPRPCRPSCWHWMKFNSSLTAGTS